MDSQTENYPSIISNKEIVDWHQLIDQNMNYINKILYKYSSALSSQVFEELKAEVLLAITISASKFKGCSKEFKTYLYIRIQGAVTDFFRKENFIKRSGYKKIRQIMELKKNDSHIVIEEIAKTLGETVQQIAHLETLAEHIKVTIQPNATFNAIDHLQSLSPTPEELVIKREDSDRLANRIPSLEPRDQVVVKYYLEGKSLIEIGQQLGIAAPTVSIILKSIRKCLFDTFSMEDQLA